MKILVIEDDADAAFMLEQLLKDIHEVRIAYSGREAIDISASFKPHLIISDWKLDEAMDGVTACQEILKHHTAPIIFVSGSPLEELKQVAEALMPLHILGKPIDLDHLSATIQGLGEGFKMKAR